MDPLREALEAEWYNGTLDETAYDRLLAALAPDPLRLDDARLVAAMREALATFDLSNGWSDPADEAAAHLFADDRVRDWLAERLREVEPHDGWTTHAYRQVADAILGRVSDD